MGRSRRRKKERSIPWTEVRDMTWLRNAASSLFVFAATGCMGADIGVIDLGSGAVIHPPHHSGRQVVVQVNREAATFTTLRREGKTLLMQTFDRACRPVAKRTIPLFVGSFCASSEYAVSDDLEKIAYLIPGRWDLVVLDVPSGRTSVLQERFVDSQGEMPLLVWVDQNTLLLVLRRYPGSRRETNEILLYDTELREGRTLCSPVHPSNHDYAVSPDRDVLAFRDAGKRHSIYGEILVISLLTGETLMRLGSGSKITHHPSWNPDGSELAFVEGKELSLWSRGTGDTRVLKTFSSEFTCYEVVVAEGLVGYVGSTKGTASKSLVILDSRTGREVRSVSAQFNGTASFLVDQLFVFELGY